MGSVLMGMDGLGVYGCGWLDGVWMGVDGWVCLDG